MSFSDTKLGASWSSSSTSQEKGDTSNSGSTKMSFVETATSSTKEGNSSTMPSSSEETVSLERGSEHKSEESLKRRTIPMLSNTYKIASQDVRTYLIQKELLESQVRRMQVEIAGLQSEKRQLTDHSNAVQARSSDLESQLAEVTNQLDVTKARIGQEITEASRKLKAAMETKMDALHHNNIKLSSENEKLKAELISSKQSKSESERTGSKLNEQTLVSLKSENSVLKAELAEVKTLLNQSEDHVISLEEKKRSAEVSLAKLSKVKDFLQLSEGSGQGAADKIIRSLEKRLRVTEERFFKERADRGHTLSEVEEKLLAENSNLLVAEKELSRQLQRSQDRCRHLELKVKDMREENMNLRLALPLGTEIPTSTRKSSYDLSNSVHSTIRAESKLMTSDMKEIMTHVQRETGLSGGQEVAMVCELWRRYDVATHKLQQWEQELFQLKITHGNIALGLQNLREMKAQYEEKIRSAEEEVEDILNEKNTMETTYKQQLSELVSERHEALAKLQTMEDLMAGLKAENEALQQRVGEGDATHDQTVADLRAEIVQLQSEKEELEVKLTQLSRQTKLQEGEIDTLKSEVEVKDRSLEAATHDLEVAEEKLLKDGLSLQEEIDSLNEQVVDLQAEVQIWKEKYHSLSAENIQMEEKVEAAKHSAVLSKVKAIEEDESEKSVLEHDLSEREADLKKLTNQYQTVELELEQTRRNLLVEAERRAEVENHLENIQEQLNEKQRSVERLGQSEHQSSRQYDSLKGALDSMMQELRKSQASLEETRDEVKRLQVELSQEKDRTQRLQESFTQGSHGHNVPGEIIQQDIASYSLTSSSGAELRLKNLDRERDQLKQELSESLKTVEFQRGEISELHERVNSVTQELRAERETLCQLAADKSDLEQHLQSCIEERDEIYKQKEECDHDLHKLEQNLHDVITKFDLETRERLGNFQSDYANLGPDAHNLIEECVSLRLLLEGKDTEIRMLTDKISRQNDELDFLRHRVEMLLSENLCHRNDITRHTAEATQKMEELRSSAEVNDLLVTERARLQLELEQTRSELGRELEHREQRNAEVAEILRKFDQSAESRKTTQEELHKLDNKSVALETELRHTNRTLAQLETENQQNKAKLERANEDIRSLTNANATLEKNLEIEKHTGFESRQSLNKLQDELREKTQQLEFVKHEKAMLLTNLDMERKTADNLKTQLETKEGEITALKTEVKEMAAQIESFKGRLLVSQESFEQVCKDKQNVYGDYQELCRQLNEKEKQLEENKAMSESSMENIHQEFSAERVNLEAERSRALAETEAYRDEIRDLKEQLSQKELQLCTFGRTLQELEEMTKQNQELEDKLVKMNSAAEDTKILINSHRTEIMTLRETHKALEEKYVKLDAEHKAMEDDFRSKRQGHDEQLFEFRQTTAEMKTSHEMEKFELREKLSRTEGQLETAQANLTTLHSAHKDLQENCHNLESTLQEVKSQLQQTATQKHALAERMATLESQVSNSRRLSEESSGKLAESQVRHSKVEQDLAAQLAKNKKLEKEFAELEAAAFVHRSNMKAKQDQVDLLQAEVNKLRQVLESHRQQMASKYKKAAFDLKQQTNSHELERNRLTSQCDQLTSDLEQAREQITVKSRENLKLQEDLFNLEAQLRDATSKLRQASDSLRHETEMQEKLSSRIQEQDEELKKVRVFLSQKGDEAVTAGEGKMAWNDINRSMKELSLKMDNLKSQKITDNDSRDHKSFQRLRKHLAELETELHTEKALHQITRSSLQASEDDCQRLRRQLRSKQRTLSGEDRSEKSRMEKINEIIAKSQTQAQLLMASGGYHDYSSSRDMSLISPRSMSHSPDNSLADHPALFNTSLNNNNGTSSPPASSQSPRTSTPSSKT